MRRAVVLGVTTAVVVAVGALAFVLPPAPEAAPDRPHITRMFIPAIKVDCQRRANIANDVAAQVGYTFAPNGALRTIDQDGTLTGIDAGRLIRFNTCLARYPIEPIWLPPHDHYSRNLLYDYYSSTLQPCLAGKVTKQLPPLPTRADFVVRLYAWDPYRILVPDFDLDQLLVLATACPPLPVYLSDPADVSGADAVIHPMSSPDQQACFTAAGLITDPSESWGVVGLYLNVYDAEGDVVAALNTQVTGVVTGRTVLNCLHGVP